jgi:hypothetical protein
MSIEQLYDSALIQEGLHPNPADILPRIQQLLTLAAAQADLLLRHGLRNTKNLTWLRHGVPPRRHSQCGQLYLMMGWVARRGVGYNIAEEQRPYPNISVWIRPFSFVINSVKFSRLLPSAKDPMARTLPTPKFHTLSSGRDASEDLSMTTLLPE